uniref:Uncharacterized protein n=1 Tax=Peronospora matthiolae TaxID=2874970 RepID=A0AAV1T719_9STRA
MEWPKKEIRSHAAVGSGLSGLQVKLQAYAGDLWTSDGLAGLRGGSLDFRRTYRPTRGISGLQTNLQAYAGDLWTSDELAGLRGGCPHLRMSSGTFSNCMTGRSRRSDCKPVVAAGASSRVDEGAGELDSTQPLSEIDISQGPLRRAQASPTDGYTKVSTRSYNKARIGVPPP